MCMLNTFSEVGVPYIVYPTFYLPLHLYIGLILADNLGVGSKPLPHSHLLFTQVVCVTLIQSPSVKQLRESPELMMYKNININIMDIDIVFL